MKPITVLIVDDSALIRQMFTDMLDSESDIKVLGTACDPLEAREKIKQLNPDVLTLDIEMPKMDGISFLEKIMVLRPMPVIMVSSLTQKGAEASLRALELGAFDAIGKPSGNQSAASLASLHNRLISSVRAAAKANIRRPMAAPIPAPPRFNAAHSCREVIAIGASTGGVETLKEIFMQLPHNLPPILVTQHMPERFTASFAARLDSISALSVKEASHNEPLLQGHAYIAPGGLHLSLARQSGRLICRLEDTTPVSGHKPSVDVLFHSVARCCRAKALGVILTGMGKDGAVGLKAMRDAGAFTIGQDEASCVVYGMPQAAARIDAVMLVSSIADLPRHLIHHCEKRVAA